MLYAKKNKTHSKNLGRFDSNVLLIPIRRNKSLLKIDTLIENLNCDFAKEIRFAVFTDIIIVVKSKRYLHASKICNNGCFQQLKSLASIITKI